ncbi:hypothetical protein ACFLWN_04235 [Chloroflexota bacterium]
MNLRRVIIAIIFVMLLPLLLSCETLGMGNSQQDRERAYYEEQLKAHQKQQEAYREQQEAYNKALAEGLQQWSDAYQQWQGQQQAQQRQQLGLEPVPTTNQTDNQS